jgi:hypothetical protein
LETVEVTLPPRASMALVASSRVKPSSPPVSTNVLPASVCGSSATSWPSALVFTPAWTRRPTRSRLSSSANQAATLAAMVGPTPSTAASSSSPASAIASSDFRRLASTVATVPPTWRMDRPTSSRSSGRCLEASMASSRLAMDLSLKPGSPARSSAVIR